MRHNVRLIIIIISKMAAKIQLATSEVHVASEMIVLHIAIIVVKDKKC